MLAQDLFHRISNTMAQVPQARLRQVTSSKLAQAPLLRSSNTLAQAIVDIMFKAQVPLPVTPITTQHHYQVSSSMLAQAPLLRSSNTLAQAIVVIMFKAQVPLSVTLLTTLLQLLNSNKTTLLLLRTNRTTLLLPRTNQFSILLLPRTYKATAFLTLTQVGATWALVLQSRTTACMKL